MRTFIAITLPQEIKETLARLQAQLKKCDADVKWVAPANIHLTLKFIGEIDESALVPLENALDEACAHTPAYSLSLGTLGAFPKPLYPRILWIGVTQGNTATRSLALRLEESLAALGMPKEEREFSSHITIARVRSGKNRQNLVAQISQLESYLEGKIKEVPVTTITLFKSTLSATGPRYEALHTSVLATT